MLLTCPICAQHAHAAEEGEVFWEYEGQNGPHMWGALDPSFATCSAGTQQSPVDLTKAVSADGKALNVEWRPMSGQVVDNGHTIQVNTDAGNAMTLEGRDFSLLQFHFHLPSEHTVDGDAYPMEVHFVHQAAEGDLAVIGVFMESGSANATIDTIWNNIPAPNGRSNTLPRMDLTTLLPDGTEYFRYAGSLTTPPCSEVVSWVVMQDTISVSQAQIDTFESLYPMNARPVQGLNRRFILSN